MHKYSDLKSKLSVTFQEINPTYIDNTETKSITTLSIKHLGSNSVKPYGFYRPISKMISV